jgi:hypothetical protein
VEQTQKLRDALVRVKDGEWLCRAPVVFLLGNDSRAVELTPGVVYRIGVRYQGNDIAAILDDWLATGTLPAYVSLRFPGQPA